MKEKELRKLSRAELLELLVTQGQELERVKQQLAEQIQVNQNREIMLSQAGNIAEAALALNGVFEAAQKAADQYLENIQMMAGAPTGAPYGGGYNSYSGYAEPQYTSGAVGYESEPVPRGGRSRYEGKRYGSRETAGNNDYMNYGDGDSELEIYDVQ